MQALFTQPALLFLYPDDSGKYFIVILLISNYYLDFMLLFLYNSLHNVYLNVFSTANHFTL